MSVSDGVRRNLLFLARPFLLIFSWKGRAMRREVAIAAAMLPLFLLPDIILGIAGKVPQPEWTLLNIALWLLVFIGTAIRRLHDSDRDSWAILIAFFPYAGWLALLVLLSLNGTKGANSHGLDPRPIFFPPRD